MPTDPFRARMCDDVRAELDGLAQVTAHTERIVHDQRHASFMTHLRNRRDIRHIELWIANRLNIHRARIFINRLLDLLRIVPFNKLACNVEFLKVHAELIERAAVEIHRRDEIVSRLADGRNRHELGCVAGCGCDCADAAFQHGHALLEDGVSRVAHAGVYVAFFRPSKLGGAVSRVFEVIGACLVERDRAGAVGGIRFLSAVQSKGFEFWCFSDVS